MAFPKSPATTVSSYASTPLSSCPSSSISTGCSTPATPNPFAVAAISPAEIRYIVPAGRASNHKPVLAATGTPEFTQGKKLQQHQDQDHKPALAATGTPEFAQGQKLQQHQDLPESAAKFPKQENPAPATTGSMEFIQGKKPQQHQDLLESAANFPNQEINGWEHPDLCSPSKLLKNASTSIKEISRWARSSTGSKVNSNIRLLQFLFSLIQVITSTTPHPDHVVAMIRVHEALANLLLVLPKNIFPFLLQHFAQFVDELCPKRGASLSERFGNTLHDLRRSIKSGLQVLKDMILDYTSDIVPQGGGVHEITKYLLKYIMSLLDNGTSLKIILVGDEQDGKVAMETLQDIVATLISHLEIMLEKESHRYKDAGLKQMFMVNNVKFLLYQVEGSEIGYLLGDDWVLKHRDQLKEHVSSFINISWESVMRCFHVKTSKIPIFSSLPTLRIFNLEFEKTYWTQKTWKVENPLLRSNMRTSVSEKLVQAYSTYLENHKNKAPKLMKYTPEDLEELLSDLFEG
ncbi:exocyst complex component EXO70E2-like [Hordeum vulgare subsp. vulgare]|uniref:Exocyst subunit Exo70 family protein n=1 Tax=Hordeum vulgare subsp. vulgare TaxID=112509 RepID=A0A8I6YFI7_HORVV|nr:exocyst complex component EXO70E2-like [Hordeum vulgare subsp. vulgare]